VVARRAGGGDTSGRGELGATDGRGAAGGHAGRTVRCRARASTGTLVEAARERLRSHHDPRAVAADLAAVYGSRG
jgi:hypothetical protein